MATVGDREEARTALPNWVGTTLSSWLTEINLSSLSVDSSCSRLLAGSLENLNGIVKSSGVDVIEINKEK
uniref:Uncharacterized protein n=1 Tax=Ditylenchus dipsaci TaxID=166011 RepID=A0A915DIN8_9BILA